MITTSMFKRQAWMADNDEFNHIVKNSYKVLRLHDQCENHPHTEEFTIGRNVIFVYGTYVLEGKPEAKFSLSDKLNLFQEGTLPNNASNFCRQMINCMKAWNSLQETLGLPLSVDIIRQTHELMMEDKKDSWWGNIESHQHFQAIIFFAPAGHIER